MRPLVLAIATTLASTPVVDALADSTLDDGLLAPADPVTDTYFGTDVVDDYRYMENGAHDEDVLSWAEKQNDRTRQWLDRYPHYDAVAERIEELRYNPSSSYWGMTEVGGRLFSYKYQPPKQLPFLVTIDDVFDASSERLLFDPTSFDESESHAIDFYVPSHDGARVAISLSKDGTEDGTVRILDVASGEFLDDVIPRVNGGTAGGDIAWTPSNDGFFYTRYPYPGERADEDLFFYQTIWFHRLGDPLEKDHYVLGESFPRIAEIEFETTSDGRYVLADVSDGDGGYYEFWLYGEELGWTKIAAFDDLITRALFGGDDAVYLLSRKDAPHREILRMTVTEPTLDAATVVVPEGEHAIDGFAVGRDGGVTVSEIRGGPTVIRSYDPRGMLVATIGADDVASYSGLVPYRAGILFRRESHTEARAWYFLRSGADRSEPTPLVAEAPVDFSDCVVKREFATADDGTRIPITIMHLKSVTPDGDTPTLLYSYGSYGISQRPYYSVTRRAWLEQGCIYANANIRGGGDYGDMWHRQANLENKKVSVDDMAACAKYLVDAGYTRPERLAIEGGSAGGLLVYGVAVHYPERVGAVVSHVGIADMLRVEFSPNGEFNITEFGTVENETQFRGMLALSPYHHVQSDVSYPSILSLTGINDPRVEPWQPFKMTAKLQAMKGENPTLLRVSMGTGHGRGTTLSEGVAKSTDVHAFLFERLGVEYEPPEPRAD